METMTVVADAIGDEMQVRIESASRANSTQMCHAQAHSCAIDSIGRRCMSRTEQHDFSRRSFAEIKPGVHGASNENEEQAIYAPCILH